LQKELGEGEWRWRAADEVKGPGGGRDLGPPTPRQLTWLKHG